MTPVGLRRRGILALAAAVVVVALGLGLGLGLTGGAAAPDVAAELVPADTLLYVHLSTDPGSAGARRALALARRFPDFGRLERAVLDRLSPAGGGQLSFQRDLRPWLGDGVALAVLAGNGRSALGRAVLLAAVRDRARARSFLERTAGAARTSTYRGVRIADRGTVATAFVDGELVAGDPGTVRQAIDLAQGRGTPLAGVAAYREAVAGEPAGRFARLYASAAGLHRVLRAQGGLLGAVGALLDQPRLRATALALPARPGGLEVDVRSIHGRSGRAPAAFAPRLVRRVPADTLLFVGATGLGSAVGRVLGLSAAVGGRGLGAAAAQLAPLLHGESALVALPHLPEPSLTLLAPVKDAAATGRQLRGLEPSIAQAFKGRPHWQDATAGGVALRRLPLGSGELDYAVARGEVLFSTSGDAIAQILSRGPSLAGSGAFRAADGDHPRRVTSILFLDFSQLLRLGEQTGLTRSAAFREVRADLERVHAVGATSSSGETTTTAELFLQIP